MDILPIGIEPSPLAKPKEQTLKDQRRGASPERNHLGINGEIISEWVAISNRNQHHGQRRCCEGAGRHHEISISIMPDINDQRSTVVPKASSLKLVRLMRC